MPLPEELNPLPSLNQETYPTSPSLNTGIPVQPNTLDLYNKAMEGGIDQLLNKPQSVDSKLGSVKFDWNAVQADRYVQSPYLKELGLDVNGVDNEQKYGERQTKGNKISNALIGGAKLAMDQFGEQLGSWKDTFDFLTPGTDAFKQSDLEELSKQSDNLFNKYAIFQTKEDQDSILNFNTIANTIQQSGYAVGAIGEIAAEELALTALTAATFGGASELQAARSLKSLENIGRATEKTSELIDQINSVSKVRKVFDKIKEWTPLTNSVDFAVNAKNIAKADQVAGLGRGRTIARGFGAFYRDVREVNAAVAEAKGEAAGTNKQLTDSMVSQFKDKQGRDPNAFELKSIQDNALAAAQTNGAANVALILASNKLEFGNTFSGPKMFRHLAQDFGEGILAVSDKTAEKTGAKLLDASANKWLAFKQGLIRSPLGYAKTNLVEALQENAQDISNDTVKAYYEAKFNHKNGDPIGSYADFLKDAASKQFTVEGAKTFLSGFMTGAIIGGGTKLYSTATNTALFDKASNYKEYARNPEQFNKKRAEQKAEEANKKADLINTYNQIWANPLSDNFSGNKGANLQSNFRGLLGEAARNGDMKIFNDIKDDSLRHIVLTGIRSGNLDSLSDRMHSYVDNLSPEEFASAFGFENTQANQNAVHEQLNKFDQRAQEIKDIYGRVSDRLINPFNPFKFTDDQIAKADPEYVKEGLSYKAWNDAVDNLVFSKDYYNRTLQRQQEVLEGIKTKEGFDKVSFNDVFTLTNIDNVNAEIDILDKEIENLSNATDEKSKEILKDRKAKLNYLEKYHAHLQDLTDGLDSASELSTEDYDATTLKAFDQFKKKAQPLFTEYVNHTQRANKQNPVTTDAAREAFENLHDYYRLQHEAPKILLHVNLLADPENFKKYFQAHDTEIRTYYHSKLDEQRRKEEDARKPNEPGTNELKAPEGKPTGTNKEGTKEQSSSKQGVSEDPKIDQLEAERTKGAPDTFDETEKAIYTINSITSAKELEEYLKTLPESFLNTYSSYIKRVRKDINTREARTGTNFKVNGRSYYYTIDPENGIRIVNSNNKKVVRGEAVQRILEHIFKTEDLTQVFNEEALDYLSDLAFRHDYTATDEPLGMESKDRQIQEALQEQGGFRTNKFYRSEARSRGLKVTRFANQQADASIEDFEFSPDEILDFLQRFPNGMSDNITEKSVIKGMIQTKVWFETGYTPTLETVEKILPFIPIPEELDELKAKSKLIEDEVDKVFRSIGDYYNEEDFLTPEGLPNWEAILEDIQNNNTLNKLLPKSEIEEVINLIKDEIGKQAKTDADRLSKINVNTGENEEGQGGQDSKTSETELIVKNYWKKVSEDIGNAKSSSDLDDVIMMAIVDAPGGEAPITEISSLIDKKREALEATKTSEVTKIELDPYDTVEEDSDFMPFEAKPDSAFNSTGQEAIDKNTEEIDPTDINKHVYYNALRAINKLKGDQNVNYEDVILPNGQKGVYITAINGSAVPEDNLESRTVAQIGTKPEARKGGAVFVLTDQFGFPYKFTEAGEIAQDGKWATTSIRDPKLGADGRYSLPSVQTPGEIAKKAIKDAGEDEEAIKSILEAVDAQQQLEFKALYDLRKRVIAGDRLTLTINNITYGYLKPDFNNPTPLSKLKLDSFTPYAITDKAQVTKSVKLGGVYINHSTGIKVLVVRPGVSENIADTIEHIVYDDKNLSIADKLDFINTMIYKVSGKVWFSEIEGKIVPEINGEKLNDSPEDRAKLKQALLDKKININKSLLGSDFVQYTLEGGKLKEQTIPYNKFIKENFLTYLQPDAEGNLNPRNAYVNFSIDPVNTITGEDFNKGELPDELAGEKAEVKTPKQLAKEAAQARLEASRKDPNALNKLRSVNNSATEAQNKEAKEWFDKSPLSKFIPLKELFSIVNSDAFATWSQDGITLFSGANHSDLYHEAFHGFTQLFLTGDQKKALYDEARTLLPGKSDLQVEETLAEDFRKYVLSGSTKVLDKRPAANTIFRKIYNFLKALFTGVKYSDLAFQDEAANKIKELYDNLHKGDFYSAPDVKNIQFGKLNKGIEAGNDMLSNADSKLLVDTLNSLIRKELRIREQNPNILFENKNAKAKIYGIIKDVIELKSYEDNNEDQQRILDFAVNNFPEVIRYFEKKSKYLTSGGKNLQEFDEKGIAVEKPQEGEDTTGNEVKDSLGAKSGNEESIKATASDEVLYLVSGLFQVDKQGKQILNDLGEPKLVDFDMTWNRLIKTLQGTISAPIMLSKLVKASKEFPEFGQLVAELGNPNDIKTLAQFNLWSKFRQDLGKPRIPIMEALIENTDKGLSFKFSEARPDVNKVNQKFTDNFQTSTDKTYINTNESGENTLNTRQFLLDFTTKLATEDLRAIKPEKTMEALSVLGFKFSDNPEIKAGIQSFNKINYLVNMIYEMGKNNIPITNPIKQFSSPIMDPKDPKRQILPEQQGSISTLLELEAKHSDAYSNYSVINPEGNREWEHSLNNTMSVMFSVINDAETYPTYQDVMGVPELRALDISKNPMIVSSIWRQSLFNDDGTRRLEKNTGLPVTLQLVNLSGIKQIDSTSSTASKGVKTGSLDANGKFLFDFNLLLSKGIIELPRHADKGTYYAIKVSQFYSPRGGFNKFSYLQLRTSEFLEDKLSPTTHSTLKGYLKDELTRIQSAFQGVGSDIKGYAERSKDFSMFDDILTAPLKAKLIQQASKGADIAETLEVADEILKVQFKNYFDKLEDAHWKKLSESPTVSQEIVQSLSAYIKSISGKDNTSQEYKLRVLNRAYTYNAWVYNAEAVKFLYGDLAFYSDFSKRNAAIGSTGKIPTTDQGLMGFINSKGRAVAANLGYPGESKDKKYDGTMTSVVFKDVNPTSVYHEVYSKIFTEEYKTKFPGLSEAEIADKVAKTLKAYTSDKIVEGDAQGWITFDSYRAFKMALGDWSEELDKLYNKAVRGEYISPDEALMFPPLKPQYFGPLKTDTLYVPGFHKFSLVPLVPGLIKGTKMEDYNRNLISQGIDYALFESGSKVATIGGFEKFYDNLDKRTPYLGEYKNKNTIYARYMKEQVEIAPHFKGQVIFSTQMRKLIDVGLFDQGVPTFEGAKELADKFIDNISALTELKKQKLMKETGIVHEEDGYKIKDYEPLVNLIRKEFENREMPDHIIEFIDLTSDNKLKYPLDLSTQTQKIESVLQSIVNNRLIRQKVNGESLVQVASSGFESNLTNASEEDKAKYGTNDLPFYSSTKGQKTSAMKIKLALTGGFKELLNLTHTDGERVGSIDRLNEVIKDDKWLDQGDHRKMITLVGTRIPVQGLNSMEFMEVHHFLPQEAGNIVIVPTEIVAKSGSDFDIDKLNIFMPNIHSETKTINGKEVKVPTYSRNTSRVEGVENQLIENMRSILEREENFVQLVTPNSTDAVEYLSNETAHRMSSFNPNQRFNGETSSKVSPTTILSPLYNLYKFEANNVSKESLGVGAKFNTFSALLTRAGAYLSQDFVNNGGRVPVKILLPHNTIELDGQLHISFSGALDTNKENRTQEIISQLMNGWVDAGKNPWIFNINGSLEVSPIILFLNQIGTPIEHIVNFVTQPAIVEYTTKLREANNLFKKTTSPEFYQFFKNNLRKEAFFKAAGITKEQEVYFKGIKDIRKLMIDGDIKFRSGKKIQVLKKDQLLTAQNTAFTLENLKKDNQPQINNVVLLYQYFELEELSGAIRDVQTALDFDTNKDKDAADAQIKANKFYEALAAGLLNKRILNDIRNDSVIKSFAIQNFSLDFQAQLLPLRNSRIINRFILDRLGDLPIDVRGAMKDKFIRTFKNDLIQNIFQNYAFKNRLNLKSMFTGDKAIGNQLIEIKNKYPQLEKYQVVAALVRNKSKEKTSLINVKPNESSMETDKINIYHDEFTRLVNPDLKKSENPEENAEITKFFSNLAVFGFLQSGLNKSYISFTEIIPQSLYTKLMEEPIKTLISKFSDSNAEGNTILKKFYQKFRQQNSDVFPVYKLDELGNKERVIFNKESYRLKDYREEKEGDAEAKPLESIRQNPNSEYTAPFNTNQGETFNPDEEPSDNIDLDNSPKEQLNFKPGPCK